jgi:hypothetical protein
LRNKFYILLNSEKLEDAQMKAVEQSLSVQQVVGSLAKSVHKSLDLYKVDALKVVKQDPDLFAHLIAWNHINGEIRDTKVAFPIFSLRGEPGATQTYFENAVAHLLLLDPRNLVRASYFHRDLSKDKQFVEGGASSLLKYGILQYLQIREKNNGWWDRTVLQHRISMKTLYALHHIKPSVRAQKILFDKDYPEKSVFFALRNLKSMAPTEAAGTVLNFKIPFTIAIGALGGVAKNTDVILALIESMSSAELITNTKMLTKLGVMENPVLKSSFEKGLVKAQKDKKMSSLKAGKAMEAVTDVKVKAKLEKVQEAKIDDIKGLEGDWLVLGDRSGSMSASIEKAKEVSAFLARMVKGKVWLVFFNVTPTLYDVSGKTLEEIKKLTTGVRAGGGTSIGCGLQLIMEKNIVVNGIVAVSDGGENTPPIFSQVYKKYETKFTISPNVYLLHVPGESDTLTYSCEGAGIAYSKMDVSRVDYYSMPNLARMLRSSRYTLIDDIMQTPLLRIADVLKKEEVN